MGIWGKQIRQQGSELNNLDGSPKSALEGSSFPPQEHKCNKAPITSPLASTVCASLSLIYA
jgi:hypothetical protein